MRLWTVALGGVLGGALTVGLLARRTNRGLALRAADLRAQLETRGSDVELALVTQGRELERFLQGYAVYVAEATAEEHIVAEYGIGPVQVAQMQALYERFS